MHFKNHNPTRQSESGNAVVIVLVVLVVAAVGALGYLSTQMDDADAAQTNVAESNQIADAEPASGTQEATESGEDAAGESEQANAASQMQIDEGNPVVAKVGDEEITRLDVLNYIQSNVPPPMRQLPLQQLFAMAQEQVVNAKLMEAKVDEDSVANQEEVKLQLENARKQILRNAYVQGEIDKKMTDDRLQAAYNEYKENFEQVEELKARHMLVAEESKAKDIIQQLNDGADFAELAQEHSTDGTANNGGDLGYFAKSDVVPEFADAAFALEEGSITQEPVKTQFGYHVIKAEDKRQRPVPEFEDVKQQLESNLRREVLEEIMAGWRESAKIEVYDINGKPVEETENN